MVQRSRSAPRCQHAATILVPLVLVVGSEIVYAQGGNLQCTHGVLYQMWDDDADTSNVVAGIGSVEALRQQCFALGLSPVRLQSATQAFTVLRPLIQQAGYDLARAAGVPLAYAPVHSYHALDNAAIAVGPVLQELQNSFNYSGELATSGELVAGFGWGTNMISSWTIGMLPIQAIICSDNALQQTQSHRCDLERLALLKFRAGGDPDNLLSSWVGNPCGVGWDSQTAGWQGLKCGMWGGRVTHLDLHNRSVSGSIDALAPLISLREIQLHETRVTGAVESLSSLAALEVLSLHDTMVAGRPSTLARCVRLTWLSLYRTRVLTFLGELATRSSLTQLYPNCPPGRYSLVHQNASAVCANCPSGRFSPTIGTASAADCSECFAGKYSSAGLGRCIDCDAGKYVDIKGSQTADACIDCPAGKFVGATETCSPLGSSFVWWAGACIPRCMMLGATWNDHITDCQDCTRGKYASDTGRTSCSNCEAGRYTNAVGSAICTECAAGKYLSTVGNRHQLDCIGCVAGRYSDATGAGTDSDCIACQAGKYNHVVGSNNCIGCEVGKYVDVTGSDEASDCIHCIAGKYIATIGSVDAANCTDCVAGKYSATIGSATILNCIGCPSGKHSTVAGSDSVSSCIHCAAGKYGLATGSASCIECELGKYFPSIGNNNGCIECSAGRYADVIGETVCIFCVAGRYMDIIGAADCIDCEAGRYLDTTGNSVGCIGCPPGMFGTVTAYADASGCTQCATGRYVDAHGATDCIDCPKGKYGSMMGADEQFDCIGCASGKYLDISGQTNEESCKFCAPGRYGYASGKASCIDCRVGTYSSAAGGTSAYECTACEQGKYKNIEGLNTCKDCVHNSYTVSLGAYSVSHCLCNAGYSGVLARESSSCSVCPASTYKENTGLPRGRTINPLDDFNTVEEFDAPGRYSYTVPGGVTTLLVFVWGAGGGGGAAHLEQASGGGGGGFSMETLAVVSGQQFTVVVGAGGNASSECTTGLPLGSLGHAGGSSSFGTVDAEGGYAGRDLITPGAGGQGTTAVGHDGGVDGGTAGGSEYGGGVGGRRSVFGTLGAAGRWPGGGSGGHSYCAQSPDLQPVSGGDGAVIVVAGPISALAVRECSACHPNAITGAVTAVTTPSDCVCSAGYQAQMGDDSWSICTPCPQDMYKDAIGTDDCTQCPTHASTVGATGSVSLASCYCSPGYTAAGTSCTPCPVETYKASHGDGTCSHCPLHSTTLGSIAVSRLGACVCDQGYEASDSINGRRMPTLQSTTFTCEECAAGTYKSVKAAQLCTQCPAHSSTYNFTGDARSVAWTHIPNKGCASVSIGTYSTRAEAESACVADPSCWGLFGLYCDSSDDWRTCPANGHSDSISSCLYEMQETQAQALELPLLDGQTSVDACLCTTGYEGNLTSADAFCAPCSRGKYKSAVGPGLCVDCPANSSTIRDGAQSVEECLCLEGWVGALTSRSSTCDACPADFFKSSIGSEECQRCPVGSGTRGLIASTTVYNCSCSIGHEIHVEITRSRGEVRTCARCPPNKYKDNTGTGAERCRRCTDHASTLNNGSISVTDCQCNPGYQGEIVDALSRCNACPANTYKQDFGLAECNDCVAHTTTNDLTARTRESECICELGYGWVDHLLDSSSAPLCQACPMNTYKDRAATVDCTPCRANSITHGVAQISDSACLCMKGYGRRGWGANVRCQRCAADQYKAFENNDRCLDCTEHSGTEGQEGQINVSSCLCAKGYHSSVTDSVHHQFTGDHLQADSICMPCMIGSYKDTIGPGEAHPHPCSVCTANSGTAAPASTAVTDCTCDVGYTGQLRAPHDFCTACAAGKYKYLEGPQACVSCPDHSSTWTGIQATTVAEARTFPTDCLCNRGWTGVINTQADVCSPCPAGKYKQMNGGVSGCLACTEFSSTAGTTPGTNVSACLCDPGYQGVLDTAAKLCEACPVDTYKESSGTENCLACPGASNTNGTTASMSCFCDPGYEFLNNECRECPVGKFKAVNGQQPCEDCPAHSTTADPVSEPTRYLTASTSARLCVCDDGYTGRVTDANSVCEACEIGRYKSRPGEYPCERCTTNSVTVSVARRFVSDCQCAPGYLCATSCNRGRINHISSTCTACPVHKYKTYTGPGPRPEYCDNCPADSGTWTSNDASEASIGATRVRDCVCRPGHYGRLVSQTDSCSQCSANFYKSDHSIYNCVPCPTGSSTFGALGSTTPGGCMCDKGYVGKITNQYSYCSMCAIGSYKAYRGEQLCTICPANMVTDPKNTSIRPSDCFCAAGYVRRPNQQGEIECIRCELEMADNTGCEAYPPRVFVEDLVYPRKVSSTKRVYLLGGYETIPDPNEPVTFSWRAWQELPDKSSLPMDIASSDMFASKLTSMNLVIRENSLLEGATYRFRFVVKGLIASADFDSIFTMNVRPSNGSLSVDPALGVAMESRFLLSTLYWFDEDLPFTYQFGYLLHGVKKWITQQIYSSSTTAILPPGSRGVNISTANFTNITSTDGSRDTYELFVVAADAFEASAEVRTDVTVMPYNKVAGRSWADDMLAQTNVSGTDLDPAQAYTAAAETLNSLDTSEEDVAGEEIDLSAACTSQLTCSELSDLYGGWPAASGLNNKVCAESDAGLGLRNFAPAVQQSHVLAQDEYNLVWRNPTPLSELAGKMPSEGQFYYGCRLLDVSDAVGVNYNFWEEAGVVEDPVDHMLNSGWPAHQPPDYYEIFDEGVFEAPVHVCEDCATRIMMDGYFRAAEDGDHTFRVSADGDARIWFGTSIELAMSTDPIASVPGDEYIDQTTTAIRLTAGTFYYIRAIVSEAAGGGNLAVGVTTPSVTMDPIHVFGNDGNAYMFRDARMKLKVNGVHDDVEFAQLRDCLVTQRAVCAKLCADVDGCIGYEFHSAHSAKCVLFDHLSSCKTNNDCIREAAGHTANPDQCYQGYCAVVTTDTQKLIGLADPDPNLVPPETVPSAECVRAATWHTAATACINIGARLCTQAELQNNEAANTGCFESDEMVWSSEDIGCQVGQHMAVCGYSGDTVSDPPVCTDDSTSIGIRCCADVDNYGRHLCLDPSAPEAVGLQADLTNARGQMIAGLANSAESGAKGDKNAMQSGALESVTASADQLDARAQAASLSAIDKMVHPSSPAPAAQRLTECDIVANDGRRRRRLGATEVDLRRRMEESTCQQPPDLNQDGAQSSASAVSNVMAAAAAEVARARMMVNQAVLEEQRLQRIAECHKDCEDKHPPVQARQCKHDRRRLQDDDCAEWECFEYGEYTCTEYWDDDMICDSRCRVALNNGGLPSTTYDPYEDNLNPCSRTCRTWMDCCVTEGVQCVADMDKLRRRTEASDGPIMLSSTNEREGLRSFQRWLMELRSFFLQMVPTEHSVHMQSDSELASQSNGSSGAETVESLGGFKATQDHRPEPGQLSGHGYMYGPARLHTFESQGSTMCSAEVAACTSDSACTATIFSAETADSINMVGCMDNAHCAAIIRCAGSIGVNADSMLMQNNSEHRRLQSNRRGCLYGRKRSHCNTPPCRTFKCKTMERECRKDTFLDASAQQQCQKVCNEDHSRRAMQDMHKESYPSHPRHLHQINKMLQAVHYGHGRRALMQSQSAKDEIAAGQAGSVLTVLGGVGTAVAGRLYAGEEAEQMQSARFTMEVQQFTNDTVEGAVVGGGQVQVPTAQDLAQGDVSTQTISWNDNPYSAVSGSDAATDSAAALGSQVLSVKLTSGQNELPVAGLQETFNITLRRTAISVNNASNDSHALLPWCSSFSCINTYDVAHGPGACWRALHDLGYTCEEHFCSDCNLSGFCDLACIPSCNSTSASNTSTTIDTRLTRSHFNESVSTPNCTLDPSPSCAYWDVSAMRWRTDGVVLNVSETTITCAFRHLTDFSGMFATPTQTADLASLSDTFDLAAFALANPVGLAVSLALFCLLITVATQSLRDVLRERKTRNVRHKIKTDVINKRGRSHEYVQKFALWEKDAGHQLGDRIAKMIPTRLRSDYLCGSFWFGLKGEPFDKWQRLLVVLCTFLLTLMVNVFFFQSKHNQLEVCEGPLVDGRPSNCSGGVTQQSLCQCRTFDCDVKGCNNCERCDTIESCSVSCPAMERNRIVQTFVTILLTWPIGSLLKWLFEWLHRPYVKMVEAELELAREVERHASVKHRRAFGLYRRYGREQIQLGNMRQSTSDVAGDEASQLWTESEQGQQEVRMEEEAAEVHKEDWEKRPIMPDGKLPCEECGDRSMFPLAMIERYEYSTLERKLANEITAPTYERILAMYDEKELCCILHNHNVSYSYTYKRGLQHLQQSKAVMAWQVHRMIDTNSGVAERRSTQQVHKKSRSKTMENVQRVFNRKDGTNWEHAIEQLKLPNPGRSVGNHILRNNHGKKKKGLGVCPQCKGTGSSGLVWFTTGRVVRDGKIRSECIAVTPAKRRIAMKASARKMQLDQRRRGMTMKRRKPTNAKTELPQLDDIADRRQQSFGQWDVVVPYIVGLVVGLFCVLQIARTVRNFSSPRTVEWITSSIVSLVLSWTLTDPLKVLVTTPLMAWKNNRKVEKRTRHLSRAHARLQGAVFLGGGASGGLRDKKGLAKFRKSTRAIEHVVTALDVKQRRVLRSEVRKHENKYRQDLAERHAHEERDLENDIGSSVSTSGARASLKQKQQLERQQLNKQMQIMDDDLHDVLNGQHAKFQGSLGPSEQSHLQSQLLMSNYNTEAAQFQEKLDAKKRADQNELHAKIAQKRRQMAERIASVEMLLHVNGCTVGESETQKAAKEQAQKDEVAAMKQKLAEATAKMERVLWTNRHVTVDATGAFSQDPAQSNTASKRSLSSDVNARKTGQYVGDDDGTKSSLDGLDETIAVALDLKPETDHFTESATPAAQRWVHLSKWQARVTALASLPADGPVDFARVAHAATADMPTNQPTVQPQSSRRAGMGSPRPPIVSFKEAKPVVPPRVPPRPVAALPREAPNMENSAIRASIAMARAKLAAKQRRATLQQLSGQ